ncbi:MAG: mechanosensitive ion channel family protein [archaeon]|nr:mechanosensitive ion channel family protein [archaeon]MCR4323724.1 mechanosensitive ion channel family protein [Nanoarchaeota archaeon]
MALDGVINLLKEEFTIFQTIFVVVILVVIVNFILNRIKKRILIRLKNLSNPKLQISNVKFFFRIIQTIIIITIISIAFLYSIGSWTGLGVFVGLLTAALGFALQKPIAGIAAWIIMIIKRPFHVGDRIKIGDVKGEVYDITLTHLYLDEIGGDIDSEDYSGKNIIIPNHLLFEHPIINYTLLDEYILGEVPVSVTYESELDKALKIVREVVESHVKQYALKEKREIKLRVAMDSSSMNIKARFFAPIRLMQKIKSDINTDVYKRIKGEPTVDIAYPHTEFVMKKDSNNPIITKEEKKKRRK